MKKHNWVWIATEPHKRSVELSAALGCKLYALLDSDSDIPVRFLRYGYYIYKTFWILLVNKPQVVFVQNPSVFLALIVCLMRKLFGCKVVVDRHSNFKLDKAKSPEIKWRLFHWLSKYTISRAAITLVTNDFLRKLVSDMGGVGFVLQDKLPQMNLAETMELSGGANIVVVSTFSDDEPIGAVFEVAKKLPTGWFVHVTGKYQGKKKYTHLIRECPSNVILTGYIAENEYQSLLMAVDVVVVLTTEENLLTCGAYEAISLGKALVLSDTEALRHYFCTGVIYSQNTPESLLENIIEAVGLKAQLESDVLRLKESLEGQWQKRFKKLVGKIESADFGVPR